MSTECLFRNLIIGNSLVVQWLGLQTFIAEDVGSVLGQGTKIPSSHAVQRKQNKTPNLIPGSKLLF